MILPICLLVCTLLFLVLVPSPGSLGAQGEPLSTGAEEQGGGGREEITPAPQHLGTAVQKAPHQRLNPGSTSAPSPSKGKDLSNAFSLTSRREPIYIQADGLEFDYQAKRLVYRGNVTVTQGEVMIRSDALTVTYEEEGEEQRLREVVATGNVVMTEGDRQARGKKAVFDEESRTVTLSGKAVLKDPAMQIEGETIIVFLDEGRSKVIRGEKERVKAVFHLPNKAAAGEGGKP